MHLLRMSALCTHILVLLYGLVAMSPSEQFHLYIKLLILYNNLTGCQHLLHGLVAMSPNEQFPRASADDMEDDLPSTSSGKNPEAEKKPI